MLVWLGLVLVWNCSILVLGFVFDVVYGLVWVGSELEVIDYRV